MTALRVLLPAVLLALLALLVPATAPAQADPYSPAVPAQCRVAVPTTVAGDRVVVRVRVSVPGDLSPAGTVTVAIREADGRRTVWRTTARHTGRPLTLEGPRLARGAYVARARFIPDSPDLLGCRDETGLAVGAVPGPGGGALPDTGGPPLLALLAGVGLVAAGGGLVGRGRPS
ncbi:hypothetical protein [Nocardioides humi]|uniref:Uncharacterized protein n=1 Tax=Nocardioides humi TaxID=449461 RepID=A0ABN2A6A5_9ACTN|nr:hypothetical protein [Nocardioides humi]